MQTPTTHTSREIAQAIVDRAFEQVRRDREYNRVLTFALDHLPGPTKARPVRCRHCGNSGLAKRGSHYVPCTEDHTEDGVECSMCFADAMDYVQTADGLTPVCDFHKARLYRAGLIVAEVEV